jgi:hypothetical protein
MQISHELQTRSAPTGWVTPIAPGHFRPTAPARRRFRNVVNQNTKTLLNRQLHAVVLRNVTGDQFGNLQLFNVGLDNGMSLQHELLEHGALA